MNLGWTEMLLIAGVALLLFGPTRLPGLGKSMGQAIRGFKKGLSEDATEEDTKDVNKQISHDSQNQVRTGQTQGQGDKNRQS